MPVPKPDSGESQSNFISRCMDNDTMNSEYPEREQRAAVCFSSWRRKMGKSLDKDTRGELPSPDPRVKVGAKAGEGDQGWLEGYASVFDVIDSQNEVVRKGAFAKSIKERVPAGKVKLMVRHMAHGGDTLDIAGIVTEAKEDKHGLWMHAEFAGTETAQTARQLAAEGMVGGLSIGYLPVQWRFTEIDGKEVVELKELKLLEATMTAIPANEHAAITAAKAVCDQADAIERDVDAPDEGRVLSPEEAGRIDSLLAKIADMGGKLSALRVGTDPQGTREAALHSAWTDVRRKRLRLLALKMGAKALSHNNNTSDSEPRWSGVDKTKLPRKAFADMGDPDKVSTWRYPHHWVSNGGAPDDDGRYTTGTMHLHKGGLNAAWAAAQGARAGREAPPAVKSHLNAHRKVLGLGED